MTWPLEGVLMQQGDGSASGEYAEEAPSWLECRPSPVSLPPPPGQGPDLFLSPLSFAVRDWKSVQIVSETFTQCF